MKYLLLSLILTGCSVTPGYEVSVYNQLSYCRKVTSYWANKLTIAVCDTRQECNKICEEKRIEDKK